MDEGSRARPQRTAVASVSRMGNLLFDLREVREESGCRSMILLVLSIRNHLICSISQSYGQPEFNLSTYSAAFVGLILAPFAIGD